MKTKKVNRYYCDWCGRGGCNAGHIKGHERECFKNPHRDCRVCGKTNIDTAANSKLFEKLDVNGVEAALENCPACTLSAIIFGKFDNWKTGEDYISYDYKARMRDYNEEPERHPPVMAGPSVENPGIYIIF